VNKRELYVELQSHVKPNSPQVQDPRTRPWFMAGGERRPVAARKDSSGRRLAHLWPEEDPGSDRFVDQLMFVPPRGNFAVLMQQNRAVQNNRLYNQFFSFLRPNNRF
jgi:hypothetical protein